MQVKDAIEIAEQTGAQGILCYLDKKDGLVVGYRLAELTSDHSYTRLIALQTGEILDQYHGHARHVGERKMYDDGARYFIAYRRYTYSHKWEKTNNGRIGK